MELHCYCPVAVKAVRANYGSLWHKLEALQLLHATPEKLPLLYVNNCCWRGFETISPFAATFCLKTKWRAALAGRIKG